MVQELVWQLKVSVNCVQLENIVSRVDSQQVLVIVLQDITVPVELSALPRNYLILLDHVMLAITALNIHLCRPHAPQGLTHFLN